MELALVGKIAVRVQQHQSKQHDGTCRTFFRHTVGILQSPLIQTYICMRLQKTINGNYNTERY